MLTLDGIGLSTAGHSNSCDSSLPSEGSGCGRPPGSMGSWGLGRVRKIGIAPCSLTHRLSLLECGESVGIASVIVVQMHGGW
jgi:hypothetical protein